MDKRGESLNRFMVETFNEVLKTEEQVLVEKWPDLTVREFHLLEAVCRIVDAGRDNRASALAVAQRVTAGTLTTLVALLEKKGYLERRRDSNDRRAVRIFPTERGRQANEDHAAFHQELVADVLGALNEEECAVFLRALDTLGEFFRNKNIG